MSVMALRPIPFSDLVDVEHTVMVRLVDDAGQALTPDASDSVTFRIQFAAIADINPYLSITQIVLAGAIFVVLFYRRLGPTFSRPSRRDSEGRTREASPSPGEATSQGASILDDAGPRRADELVGCFAFELDGDRGGAFAHDCLSGRRSHHCEWHSRPR